MNMDQISGVSDIVGTAGQRTSTALLNGRRTRLLRCKFSIGVNITVAGTGIRNRGSALGFLNNVGLDEAGTDRQIWDARAARFFSETNSPSALPASRLSGAGVQNVTLEETFYIYCSNPRIALPMETSFIEANVNNQLLAFMEYNGDATKVVDGGTVALSNPKLTVQQVYDVKRGELPLLLPYVRQLNQDVTGANDALKIDLRGTRYLGGIIVQQDSNKGEVTDIINKLTLRGDGQDIIGPRAVSWADLVDHQASEFGGSVAATRGYFAMNFLTDGKLSKLLHPAAYTNLRLELDSQPSVTAGVTSSRVRVILVEYESVPGRTVVPLPFEI
jgi:hypothetical protein